MRFLKSITANGTQYINTGILCNGSTHLKIDIDIPAAKSAQQQILSAVSSSNYSIFAMNNAGVWQTRYAAQASKTFANSAPGRAIYEKNANNATLTVNGSTYTNSFTAATFSMTHPLFLFARNNGGTADLFASGTFYDLIVYDGNGNIAQHFRPAMDDSEVPGVYETESGTFLYNAGSGVFAYEELPEPLSQCLMARRGGGSAAKEIQVTITSGGHQQYACLYANGTRYYSRNTPPILIYTGDIIVFHVGADSTYSASVRINGVRVYEVSDVSGGYSWKIPDNVNAVSISLSYSTAEDGGSGTATVTTT